MPAPAGVPVRMRVPVLAAAGLALLGFLSHVVADADRGARGMIEVTP